MLRLHLMQNWFAGLRAVAEIPGVGLMTATARLQHGLTNGLQGWPRIRCLDRPGSAANRHRRACAAAWYQQKRGDADLRTLLMHGARAIVRSD